MKHLLALPVALAALVIPGQFRAAQGATFTVTNTADSGTGSFRAAINSTNSSPGGDNIIFALGSGTQTISPLSPLPAITGDVFINGFSQAGASPNTNARGGINTTVGIHLDGSKITGGANGITVNGGSITLAGFAITGFSSSAVALNSSVGSVIEGCFIGLNPDGITAPATANGGGISLSNSRACLVGGSTAAGRNVISANRLTGISISGTGDGLHDIQGNIIGLDKTASVARGNGSTGISVSGQILNNIGGAGALGNIISANNGGVSLFSGQNFLEGNWIGLDGTGRVGLGNTNTAVYLQGAADNIIGTTFGTDGNYISANSGAAIDINGNTGAHYIAGNVIGASAPDSNGNRIALGNTGDGIVLRNTGGGNVVGGASEETNLIVANTGNGISVSNGNNTIEGNTIGRDFLAGSALPAGNGNHGIFLNSVSGNQVVSNSIQANGRNGIAVAYFTSGTGNTFQQNTFRGNGGLGIDLGNNGVTANDSNDADTGANNLQNFPVITTATNLGTSFRIQGTYQGKASSNITLEFFRSVEPDPSGFGEGGTYLGSQAITTNGSGAATFNVVLPATGQGTYFSATATDRTTGDTSELSRAFDAGLASSLVVTNTNDSGAGSLRQAILTANSQSGPDTITFAIPSGSTTITPGSALPAITDAVRIEGFTQPGSSANTSARANNATLKIFLDGRNLGTTAIGLDVRAPNCVIRGLAVGNFKGSGIRLDGTLATEGLVSGCYAGLTLTGSAAPNGYGVLVSGGASRIQIGGTNRAEANVISGNNQDGIRVTGSGTGGTVIQGNLIGLLPGGAAALGNGGHGVALFAVNNLVGGQETTAANVISGNTVNGIAIDGSIGSPATGNVLFNNLVGTSANGDAPVGNKQPGIALARGASNNVVGAVGVGNSIGGNASRGVAIFSSSNNNTVSGNTIGGGSNTLANQLEGVFIDTSQNNSITSNTIARNNGNGIAVRSGTGNLISANIITGNTGLGIDLGQDGVTANDTGDGDAGANNLLNYPLISSITGTSSMTVNGTLDAPAGSYTLEFFRNLAPDASGYGEGAVFLGSSTINKSGAGAQVFNIPLSGGVSGDYLTVTATSAGNTSEFSRAVRIGGATPSGLVVNTRNDVVDDFDGLTSLREAILYANANPSSTITFNIPGSGSQVILLSSALPALTANGTTINAFTQNGSSDTADPLQSVRQIVVDGAGSPAGTPGLTIAASNVTVRGMNFSNAQTHGVQILSGSGIFFKNCFWFKNRGDGIIIAPGATMGATGLWVDNTGLGINYLVAGEGSSVPTPNDALDANSIPNFPVVTRVSFDAATTQTVVEGTLAGRPNSVYTIEAFISPTGDASGYGEGTLFLGRTGAGTGTAVTTNASGNATWQIRGPYLGGGAVSALASRTTASLVPYLTSEFAKSVNFAAPRPLTLTGIPSVLKEGGPGATLTVSRDAAEPTPLTVYTYFSPEGQITAPASVVIPANQKSATFTIVATDDQLADGTVGTIVAVTAPDRSPAGGLVQVEDNDPNAVVVLPGTATVAEGGPPITLLVLRNTVPAGNALTVNLSAAPTGQLNLPATVVIPAGASEVSITVSAIDDTVLDGTVNVTVTPRVNGFVSIPATVAVTDNEQPGLGITLPAVVSEGSTGTLTGSVSRQGLSTTQALRVNLTATPTGQITLPVSVLIPAGQTTASFNFSVVNDVVYESSPLLVTATASASGFRSGSTTINVFDNDAPGGPLQAWGSNSFGQVGNGTKVDVPTPTAVGLTRVVTFAGNGSHSLAVLDDGTVRAWGYNGGGQLGDGTYTDRTRPVTVSGLTNVRAVAAGWYHSLALRGDGTVYAWGYNNTGQLGDGTYVTRTVPVRVPGLMDIKAIAAGVYFSLALKADGTVYAWGNNLYGQLGDGTTNLSNKPIQVPGLTNITAIAAGGGHSLFLRRDGSIVASGWNAYGQLGDGTTTDRKAPVVVSGVGGISRIAAGYVHSLALGSGGAVTGFGNNSYGQIGNGARGDNLVKARTVLPSGATDIGAGSNFSAFALSNGAVVTSGDNSWGQGGRGTSGGQFLTPGQVPALSNVQSVGAAYGHGLALGTLRRDGALAAPPVNPSTRKF